MPDHKPEQHLDLDSLADLLALATPEADAHLEACATCRARLTELRAALDPVAVSLAKLPLPAAPHDLDSRLTSAIDRLRAQSSKPQRVTALSQRQPPRRLAWLPIAGGLAAACAIVLAVVVVNTGDDPAGGPDPVTALDAAAGSAQTNNTGLGYTRDGKLLASELPALLNGTARQEAAGDNGGTAPGATDPNAPRSTEATPDPLQRLRTPDGLASCLTSLNEGSEGEVQLPLALDYAKFEKKPALVVVLPSAKADKVDVFVVGAACAQADANLLYFARLPAPS